MFFTDMELRNPDEVPEITTPARAFKLRHSKYDWGYQATFFDKPDYKRVEKPNTRGKVLGGSSCLNYFTWVHGSKETFDSWSGFGGEAWTWDSCKAYFDKVRLLHASYVRLSDLALEARHLP